MLSAGHAAWSETATLPRVLEALALGDWHAGLSCRQIADKHGIPGGHKHVARFLRGQEIDVQSRPERRKMPGVVLGQAVTN